MDLSQSPTAVVILTLPVTILLGYGADGLVIPGDVNAPLRQVFSLHRGIPHRGEASLERLGQRG